MSRIGATVSGFEQQLLNQLAQANAAAALNSLRLATGKQVSKPGQNPAAFVFVSGLEQSLSANTDTLKQINAASNVASQLQLTLDLVRTQLDTVRTALVADEDQTLTAEERSQKQAEIDAALKEIDSLAAVQISGRRVVDGSADFGASGINNSQVRDLDVYSISTSSVSATVNSAATQATLTYTGTGGTIDSGDATLELTGNRGTATISVTDSESLTDVRDRINQASHKTGITASVSGDDLTLTAVDYGQSASISVSATSGTFTVTGGNGDGTAQGTDADVTINGTAVGSNNVTGNRATYSKNGLHFTIEFVAGFTGAIDPIQLSDDRVLDFALSPDPGHVTSLGVPGVQAAQFRGTSGSLDELLSGGSLAGLGSNTSAAIRVVDEALSRLTSIEARVDGFADVTVGSSKELFDEFKKTLEESLETINGVDQNEESLLLSKNQALANNTLAALSILQQQQLSLVSLLQQIAGI